MKNRPLLYLCLVILAVITLFVLCGGEKLIKELCPSPLERNVSSGASVMVRGQVYYIEQKADYQALYLQNNSIQYQEQTFQESKIILYTDSEIQFHIGNTVKASGEVSFFQNARNPGNFDQKQYYQIRDIHGMIWSKEIQISDAGIWKWRDRLLSFRQQWRRAFIAAMGEEDGAAMGAIMLGEKNEMDQDLKALYQVNGIGHILAISGLHLSFIGIGMYKLLRRITGSYPIGGMFGILFLVLYIMMIGFTVSAVRALVMFLFRVGADMTGRHYDAPTAFSSAAVVVLLWRPLYLYDGGFWLSFGAVFAILAVLPVISKVHLTTERRSSLKQNTDCPTLSAYLEGIREHMWQSILQGLTASIGINLIISPILLYYFFEFPLYSFILNLFVIPLMSVLLFLGMAGSLSGLWFEPISDLLFLVCRGILQIYKISCRMALRLPGARLVIGRPDIWQIAVYYGIMFLGLILLRYILSILSTEKREKREEKRNPEKQGNRRNRRLARSGGLVVVFLWAVGILILTARFGEAGKLATVVLDVGQGDGIFIKGPEGGTYLVDGGSSDVKKVGQYRLEPFLKSRGVGTLDYVLISHGDSDHMNGVEELIERQDIGVKIKTLVLPVQEVWDESLEGLARKARNNGIHVVVIEAGKSIREGKMTITCIQPKDVGMETEFQLEAGNAASMVLAVQYGEFDMLLTGDVEGEGEKQLTEKLEEQYCDCTWEVLKVAHHGSKNSSTEEFLLQVHPVYAFISAGQENRYGHPHQETIERLADAGSKIYSTQENGAIIVEVEAGEALNIEKY